MTTTTAPPAKKVPAKKAPAKKAAAKKAAHPVRYTPRNAAANPRPTTHPIEPAKAEPSKAVDLVKHPTPEVKPAPVTPPPVKVWQSNDLLVSYGVLLDAVKRAVATASRRPTLPVLAGLLITRNAEGKVVVRATDLERFTETVLPGAYLEADGKMVVGARMLLAALNGLRGRLSPAQASREQVELVQTKDGQLSLVGFERDLRLDPEMRLDPEDYPSFPEDPAALWATAHSEALVASFKWAARAAGKDDTLPMLTGVNVDTTDGKKLTFVATDRYRLVLDEVPRAVVAVKQAALLPASAVKLLQWLDGPVQIHHSGRKGDGHVMLSSPGYKVMLRLIDATFPAWRSLMPSAQDSSWWVVNRRELLGDVLAAASLVSNNAPVHIDFAPGKYQAHGSPARAVESSAEQDTAWTSGFNPQFLVDALVGFTGSELVFAGTSGTKPMLITGDLNHHRTTYLLMPVRLPG